MARTEGLGDVSEAPVLEKSEVLEALDWDKHMIVRLVDEVTSDDEQQIVLATSHVPMSLLMQRIRFHVVITGDATAVADEAGEVMFRIPMHRVFKGDQVVVTLQRGVEDDD
jgi:hypothetical protein